VLWGYPAQLGPLGHLDPKAFSWRRMIDVAEMIKLARIEIIKKARRYGCNPMHNHHIDSSLEIERILNKSLFYNFCLM